MSDRRTAVIRYAPGAAAGVVAWVFGYLVTYFMTASDLRESSLNQFIELLDGQAATHELVGWVFFNAHFVDTVFQGLPVMGSRTATFIGGEDGFTVLLYLLPVGVLLAAGISVARLSGASTPADGALAGASTVLGYMLTTVVGVVAVEVTAGGASAGPEIVPALVIAGIAYPIVIGTAGGALVGLTSPDRPLR
ncbi:MAG: hypothetical protein V5A34_06210 [Halapricum sp.]